MLWLAHGVIAGAFMVLLDLCGVTAFTGGLVSSFAMNLSAGAASTHYPLLYLLAAAQIAVYFVVFTLLIRTFDLRTTPAGSSPPRRCPPLRRRIAFPSMRW